MKTCFKCNKEKSLSEYYKHAQMGDGHLNKCKECTKNDVKIHRDENIDRVREYDRNRPNAEERNEQRKLREHESLKSPKYRAKRSARQKEYWEKNTIRRAAWIMTGNAIRDKRLIRCPCEVCGEIIVDAHHDDYEKPLEIRWLCKKHHIELHKQARAALRAPF